MWLTNRETPFAILRVGIINAGIGPQVIFLGSGIREKSSVRFWQISEGDFAHACRARILDWRLLRRFMESKIRDLRKCLS